MIPQPTIKYAFFGSSQFSVFVLDELAKLGLLPAVIVTTPDKPQGRKMILTATPVKEWAAAKGIKCISPAKLDDKAKEDLLHEKCDLYLVASYGKIIPKAVLDMPRLKTLNIHPSLLPKYRGPSPLQTAMLDDAKDTGVSIMQIDEFMDHGPIISEKTVHISEWPIYEDFEKMMAEIGARLFAEILPGWAAGDLPANEQDHKAASFTKKIVKEMGELDLTSDQYLNFRKIQAYHHWPQAYFFFFCHNSQMIRVKVVSASWKNGELVFERVIPEGAREMSFKDFKDGYLKKRS